MKHRNNKSGAAAVEAVLSLVIILPILFSFIFGGYNFYLKQADNVNLNFEAGRYFTTMTSCDSVTLTSISLNEKYAHYNVITVVDAVRKETYTSVEQEGTIVVFCDSAK